MISKYNLSGQVESSKAGYEDGCDSGWAHSYHEVMMMIMILIMIMIINTQPEKQL